MYHVPLIDHWLQAGSLHTPDCPLWYNASNNELVGLWIVAPFSGDFLVALNNVPACLLLALGTLELGGNLSICSPFEHLLALTVTATQVFYKQLIDNENDIAVAALFFACTTYGLRYIRHRTLANLILAAVTFGLLAGIKYYAVGYAVVIWTGLSLCAWRQNGGRVGLRVVLAGALGALTFCGYWYGRNAWLTGSPLYPLTPARGPDALSNFYPNTWRSTFLGSGRPEVIPLALTAVWKMAGPCHLLALLAVPITLCWLLGTGLFRRAHPEERLEAAGRWLLAFLTAGAGAVLLVTPWAIETEPDTLNQLRWSYLPVRFGQCFLGLAILALGVVLSDLKKGLHRLAAWSQAVQDPQATCYRWNAKFFLRLCPALLPSLFAGFIGWQITRLVQDPFFRTHYSSLDVMLLMLNGVIAGLLVCFPSWFIMTPLFRLGIGMILLIAASAGLAWGGDALAEKWHADFSRHYNNMFSTRIFTDLTQRDPSTTRLCAMDYRYYPFFGSRRQYRLCRPMKAYSYPWLADYLLDQQVNVIACVLHDPHIYGRYCDVSLWVRDHPAVFVSGQNDSQFFWADINREQLARAGQP